MWPSFLEFQTLNWKIGTRAWIIPTCITDIQSWICAFINVIAPAISVHDVSLVTNTFRTIWSVITSDFISFYKSTWIIGAEIIGDTGSGAIGTCSFLANTFKSTIVVNADCWVAIGDATRIKKTFININTMEIRISSEWSNGLMTGYDLFLWLI